MQGDTKKGNCLQVHRTASEHVIIIIIKLSNQAITSTPSAPRPTGPASKHV
jgi:hypothetical protein